MFHQFHGFRQISHTHCAITPHPHPYPPTIWLRKIVFFFFLQLYLITGINGLDFERKFILCSKWVQGAKHCYFALVIFFVLFSGFFDLISEGTDAEIERNTEENFQG